MLSKDPWLGTDVEVEAIELVFFLCSYAFALDVSQLFIRVIATNKPLPTGKISARIALTTVPSLESKFYETDEWFDQKLIYFDGLESALKGL